MWSKSVSLKKESKGSFWTDCKKSQTSSLQNTNEKNCWQMHGALWTKTGHKSSPWAFGSGELKSEKIGLSDEIYQTFNFCILMELFWNALEIVSVLEVS